MDYQFDAAVCCFENEPSNPIDFVLNKAGALDYVKSIRDVQYPSTPKKLNSSLNISDRKLYIKQKLLDMYDGDGRINSISKANKWGSLGSMRALAVAPFPEPNRQIIQNSGYRSNIYMNHFEPLPEWSVWRRGGLKKLPFSQISTT